MRLNSPQINIITKACMKASRSLIRDYGEVENLQVSTKGPGDFVSSADKRTEKILIEELQKAHPDYGIITEESGIINKSGAWFSYKGDKIGQGRENSKIFLQENPQIASEIETLIRSKSDDLSEDLMEQEIEDIPEEDEKE